MTFNNPGCYGWQQDRTHMSVCQDKRLKKLTRCVRTLLCAWGVLKWVIASGNSFEYLARQTVNGPLFMMASGQPLTRQKLTDLVKQAIKRASRHRSIWLLWTLILHRGSDYGCSEWNWGCCDRDIGSTVKWPIHVIFVFQGTIHKLYAKIELRLMVTITFILK